MKILKKMLLIVSVLCITGCKAEYNLTINNTSFDEETIASFYNKELSSEEKSTLSHITDGYTSAFNTDIINDGLNKSLVSKGKKNVLTISYSYDEDNFDNSYLINNCFDGHVFISDEDAYHIEVIGNFNCQYADNIDININTNYIVTDTNASYKNGKYTWTINKNKNTDLDLYIDILKEENPNYNKKSNGMSTFRIVGLVVLLILGLITYLLYKKSQNEN